MSTTTLIAPTPGQIFTGNPSGTVYTADSTGTVSNVKASDVVALLEGGCLIVPGTSTSSTTSVSSGSASTPVVYTNDQVVITRFGKQYLAPISALLAATALSVSGFGDSITVGVGASVQSNAWFNLVASALGAPTLNNQGQSGTILEDGNDSSGAPRSGNGRDRFVAAMLGSNKTAYAYLFYGYNDARYTAAPATLNTTVFAKQYREVINGLLIGGYPLANIILGTLWYITDAGLTSGSTGFTGQSRVGFEAFNAVITQIAAEYGMPYSDVYSAAKNGGVPSGAYTISDNIHPNDAGHALIAAALLAAAPLNTKPVVAGMANTTPVAGSLTATWTAPTPPTGITITGYDVQYGIEGTYDFANDQTVTALTATFTGLAAATYRTRVRANYSDSTQGPWAFASSSVAVAASTAAATAISVTGPPSGTTAVASTPFTASVNGSLAAAVILTPSDGGNGGTFTPTTVTFAAGSSPAAQTFTYTPASAGAKTLSFTNNGSLTNQASLTYTSAASSAATSYTVTGPTTGSTGSALSYSVQANGTLASPVTVTITESGAAGTLSASTVTLPSGSAVAQTFTFTPTAAGTDTLTFTNGSTLSNPANISVTASSSSGAPAGSFVYDTFDGTSGTTLTAHTGQLGASWSIQPGASGQATLDGSGGVVPGGSSVLTASGTSTDANQDITCTFIKLTQVTGDGPAFTFYNSATANTFYWVRWNDSSGAWELYRTVAGASANLGSFVSAFAVSASHVIKASIRSSASSVSVQGSNVTANIVIYLDGTAIIGVNDTSITAPNGVGVRGGGTAGSVTTGIHIGDITAVAA